MVKHCILRPTSIHKFHRPKTFFEWVLCTQLFSFPIIISNHSITFQTHIFGSFPFIFVIFFLFPSPNFPFHLYSHLPFCLLFRQSFSDYPALLQVLEIYMVNTIMYIKNNRKKKLCGGTWHSLFQPLLINTEKLYLNLVSVISKWNVKNVQY